MLQRLAEASYQADRKVIDPAYPNRQPFALQNAAEIFINLKAAPWSNTRGIKETGFVIKITTITQHISDARFV